MRKERKRNKAKRAKPRRNEEKRKVKTSNKAENSEGWKSQKS